MSTDGLSFHCARRTRFGRRFQTRGVVPKRRLLVPAVYKNARRTPPAGDPSVTAVRYRGRAGGWFQVAGDRDGRTMGKCGSLLASSRPDVLRMHCVSAVLFALRSPSPFYKERFERQQCETSDDNESVRVGIQVLGRGCVARIPGQVALFWGEP